MTGRYDELSDRARWFMENFDEIDLADICASNEAAAERLRQGITDVTTDMHATTGARHWIAALDGLLQPPAPKEGPPCAEVANCDGQCCKRAEQAAPVDWQAIARQRERELKTVGEARHAAEQQLAARDAALAACTAQLVDDQAVLARLRSRVQAAADEARGSMRGWLVDALADLDDPRTPAPDGGPSVAECREVDRTWPLEKAGE